MLKYLIKFIITLYLLLSPAHIIRLFIFVDWDDDMSYYKFKKKIAFSQKIVSARN